MYFMSSLSLLIPFEGVSASSLISQYNATNSRHSSSGFVWTREPPYFNGHVGRKSSGPGCRRNPARYAICVCGSFYIHDPVAQQKLLRLGKYTVCDRQVVFLAAHKLRFSRLRQTLRGHKLTRCGQLLHNGSEAL